MSLVESIDLAMGTKLPAFELRDPMGQIFKSDGLFGPKGLLVLVTCNHCPYALAVWPRTLRLAKQAEGLNIKTVAINPNIHPDYPEDSAPKMKVKIKEWQIPFPYLVDDTQNVAKSLQAQCTPDIYLFDASQRLVYHGRVDDNWQDEKKVTRQELKLAIENLAAGKPVAKEQFQTMGCSIKWR